MRRRIRLTSRLALIVAGLMCLMGAFGTGAGMVDRAEGAPASSLLPSFEVSMMGDLGSSLPLPSGENAAQAAVQQAPAPAAANTAAAPARASLPAAPAPAVVEENTDPASAAKPPPGELTAPYDLQGLYQPSPTDPSVLLTWMSDNPKSILKQFNIYRVVLPDGTLPTAPYATTKSTSYQDNGVEVGMTYRYWVTAVDKSSNESGASNTVDVECASVLPPSAPTGVTAFAIDPGINLDWNANPPGEEIAGYNVYTSKNSGSKKTKVNGTLLATNHFYYAAGSAGLYYSVTAVNAYGQESGSNAVYPTPTVPEIIQEDDPRVTTSGTWATEHYVGPNDGKIIVAEDAGATLSLSFTGSQVKMTVAKYWSCGSARVYIDGALVKTVNLYSETSTYNVVDLNVPGLVHGNHTLTVEAVGSGNPSYPYNFVNVDSFEVR